MNFDPSRLTELALQHAQLKPIYQAEASNPYAALQSPYHPVHVSDVFKELHKSGGSKIVQVPMTIKTLQEFNNWLTA